MFFAADDHAAHVQAYIVASEVEDYYYNARAASDSEDFGDRCYYSDRMDDNVQRLIDWGYPMVAFALTGPPLRRAA
ncbi:hypothetical protein GURKE_04550 [Brevundimonas phage vB_BpoS-Gurke]|uniref:Uncharacterized protein n=1 Tax=Brevundimonas phage vB_BpoS-Gurke TaxID=2948599 RepID=A0A9E7N4P6_9CAUD|nr:hypothetical protein GURKE_04550 [Brevundimonas phage vB_BpoS-Gurke]